MAKPRPSFVVQPLPAGFVWTGCTVATSPRPHPHAFVKTESGDVYIFGSTPCDLLDNYVSNDAARRTFAKLAGIGTQELNAAKKAARAQDAAEFRRARLARLRREAKALGVRIIKTGKARL